MLPEAILSNQLIQARYPDNERDKSDFKSDKLLKSIIIH